MCPSDASQFGNPQGLKEDTHTPAFESFEHATLGDRLYVQFPTKDKTKSRQIHGDVFHYPVKNETLSLGEIICLAGDFYGNWSFPEEAEQISDRWYSDPATSVRRFEANAAELADDTPGHLNAIKAAMVMEWELIGKSLKEGRDPAKEYHDNSDHFNLAYAKATGKVFVDSAYIHTARCNWDHFGKDAINAYKAGHTAALAQARKAYQTRTYDDLRYAYFLDAFALHFLTDLFSSGHLRTPRRILHSKLTIGDILDSALGEQNLDSICPADLCSQRMHDEDCENGLFVTNALGDSWAMYGDGQLFNAKSSGNLARVLQASQISLNEVYEVFKTGNDKAPGLFEPLKWIADLDKLDHPNQFVPLFKYDGSTDTLYRRTHIDQRANPSFTVVPRNKPSFLETLKAINASGSRRNRHPLVRDLPKTAPVIQLQKTGNTYTVNKFGPITSSNYDYPKPTVLTSWDMVVKSVPGFQPDGLEWASSRYLSEDVVLSVMKKEGGAGEYAGYKLDFSDGASSPIQRLWKQGGPLNNTGAAIPGKLSAGSQTTAFTPSAASNLYVFNSGIAEEPTGRDALNVAGNGLTIREAITLNEASLPSQLLARASVTDNSVRWSLHGWTEDYKEQLLFESNEASGPIAGEQWWRYVTGSLKGGDNTTQIVRILYGEHAEKDSLRIDVLKVAGNPPKVTQVSTKKYNVSSWGSPNENKYLKWLLLDVSQDGNPDIVGLINTDESTLATVVFPSRGDYTFGDPVVSRIYIPNANFNPSHFKSISVKPVEFELTHLKKVTSQNTGILQFFDNYQILGARLLGPIAPGSLYYELKGQIPSIAGQISTGAGPGGNGWQGEDWPGFFVKPI